MYSKEDHDLLLQLKRISKEDHTSCYRWNRISKEDNDFLLSLEQE
jgi:hypothetical protein